MARQIQTRRTNPVRPERPTPGNPEVGLDLRTPSGRKTVNKWTRS